MKKIGCQPKKSDNFDFRRIKKCQNFVVGGDMALGFDYGDVARLGLLLRTMGPGLRSRTDQRMGLLWTIVLHILPPPKVARSIRPSLFCYK